MSSKSVCRLLALSVVTGLIVSLLPMSGVQAHNAWPFVKATMSASIEGDLISYVVWLRVQSTTPKESVELKIKVPEGTTLVDSYAGGHYSNRGIYDGTSVGWVMASLPAEKREGPFVVIVKPSAWSADQSQDTLSSWAWVRWRGGSHTSDSVNMPHPMNPSMMRVSARGNHSDMAHIAYLDVASNISDLRTQVANWESGSDSGRRIAIEKVDRLEALIPHVAWPSEMTANINDIHEGIEAIEEGLKAQDLEATKQALPKLSSASHDLTHSFYDKWAASIKAADQHTAVHAGYLDVSTNISDLRAQVAVWEQGNDSGRRIAIEKVDRLQAIIPHVVWPEVMMPAMSKVYLALEPVKSGLKAENLAVTKKDVAAIASASHDLTHAFYDKWVNSTKGLSGYGVGHAAYLDVSSNINDLRTQIDVWEKGNDSGRRIAIEKIDRLEALVPHVDWPGEMKSSINEIHEGIEAVEAGLKAQDIPATKQSLATVASASHDLTHAFYDKWVASQKGVKDTMGSTAMPTGPQMGPMPGSPSTMMPTTPPASLLTKGQQVYASKGCGACHGAAGEGGAGPGLTHWHDPSVIRTAVRDGGGGMPGFGAGQIGEDEMLALIAYVQSLAR